MSFWVPKNCLSSCNVEFGKYLGFPVKQVSVVSNPWTPKYAFVHVLQLGKKKEGHLVPIVTKKNVVTCFFYCVERMVANIFDFSTYLSGKQ